MRFFDFPKKRKGFSLAEALIVLLIVAIVAGVTAPLITKKRRNLDSNLSHGKWACKYINDALYSATAKNSNEDLPEDSKWTKGCTFPSVAKNVKYLWVEVYGAGGGGARGFATPWIDKKDSYSLGTPVPRDGEYDISVYVSNYGREMNWLDLSKIYLSSDLNTKKFCNGSYFGDYSKESTVRNYANCKTYTASDVCIYTGDSTVIKKTDCLSSSTKAGKYCYKTSSDIPPYNYISPAEIFSQCVKDGKKDCKIDENAIKYTNEDEKCSNIRSLPSVYGGSSSPGVSGKKYLRQGEYLSIEQIKTGQNYPKGNIDGYTHTAAYDGDNYQLFHMKIKDSKGDMVLSKEIIAKMTGGTAGLFSTSMTNATSCCTNCGKLSAYPNSSSVGAVFCSKNGKSGETTIYDSELSKSNGSYTNGMSILNQYFESFVGCHGQNGSYSANLFPASKNNDYKIRIGKGGQGALGEDDNTVKTKAQSGEDTSFGWIVGKGGLGAENYCKKTPNEKNEEEANIYNAGLGGTGGGVFFFKGQTPKRNYALTSQQDTSPNNRWMINDGKNGGSGMIVVSW